MKPIIWRSLVTIVLTIITLALIAGCASPTAPLPAAKTWHVAPPSTTPYEPTPIVRDSFTTIRFHKP